MKGYAGKNKLAAWKQSIDNLWETSETDRLDNNQEKNSNIRDFFWQHRWEFLVMMLMGGFVYFVASIQPLGAGPDEEMRYLICEFIYKHGTLPHGADPEVVHALWGTSYAFKPMLTCILGGYLMRFMGMFNQDPQFLLMSARFVNVLFSMGFAWYVMQIGKKLFHGIYRIFFCSLILLLPQLLYLFTYVNNDGVALFSTAMIIYYWILGIETKWNKKSCIGTAVGCAICMLSYYNSYGYLLMSAVLFAVTMFFQYEDIGKKRYGLIVKRGVFILAIVFILAGWWFIRNAVIYDGDFLGMRVINDCAEAYAREDYKPSVKKSLFEQGISLKEMLVGAEYVWIQETYYSFIAYFGRQEFHLGIDIYDIHLHFLLASFAGFGITIVSKIREWIRKRHKEKIMTYQWKMKLSFRVSMGIAMVIPVILSLYYSYKNDFQPQGRYVMPMVIPLMYFVAKGTQKLYTTLFKGKWSAIMMVPQLYGVFHVFYDGYIHVCLPAFGVNLPFLYPVLPWIQNNRLLRFIRGYIVNGLFPG